MKRKTEDETTQTAIRLPTDLYQRLKRAGGERGMAEQIRNRLEASFAAEKAPANPATKELLGEIAFVTDKLDFYYGDAHSWSNNAFVFGALRACVNFLLTARQPAGEAVPPPDTIASLLFQDDKTSEDDVARDIVGELMREKKKHEIMNKEKRR